MSLIVDPTLAPPVKTVNKSQKLLISSTFDLSELFKPVYPDTQFSNHRKHEIIAIKIMKAGMS